MESPNAFDTDPDVIAALLALQVELGVDEPIGETPVNRYDLPSTPPEFAVLAASTTAAPTAAPIVGPVPAAAVDPVALAKAAVAEIHDLAGLRSALAAFDWCDMKKGARHTVFADGDPGARVMVIGDAPGRQEDRLGKPFVGRAGQLLDKMFDAIGLSRSETGSAGLYLTNVLPWRPVENREPSPEEIAMMVPFLHRHVTLAAPEVVVALGNVSCQALLGKKGVGGLRGAWHRALDLPVLPMQDPGYLLRRPLAKREAWHDLLTLRARLDGDAA